MQDTSERVSNALKGGVRVVAGGIEKVTDAAMNVAPDNVERSTVRLAALMQTFEKRDALVTCLHARIAVFALHCESACVGACLQEL